MAPLTAVSCALQSPLNLSDNHFDCDGVVSASRNDYVRVALAGLDELKVHRLNRRQILLDDLVERSATIVRIALDAADESNVGISIDEHLDVAQFANPVVDEKQNAVDHDYIRRLNACVVATSKVSDEIIFRLLDRFPLA
jgi:hypothetical protein